MTDDQDDLDNFFDEIEEAEAEIAEKGDNELAVDETEKSPNETQKETKDDGVGPRPPKRIRVAAASAPARPRGAMVAASAASSSTQKQSSSFSETIPQSKAPPPPPPPPPPQQQSNYHSGHSYGHQQTVPLPPLPPGPIPPPPPVPATKAGTSKSVHRMAAGKSWVDDSLADWPENDFRIFVGNLGGDVSDAFFDEYFRSKYTSVAKTKIVRDHTKTPPVSKGYGFVSFLQPLECAKAIREQDQAWVGSRPVRVKRSDWQDRNKKNVQKKNRKEAKQQKRFQSGRRF